MASLGSLSLGSSVILPTESSVVTPSMTNFLSSSDDIVHSNNYFDPSGLIKPPKDESGRYQDEYVWTTSGNKVVVQTTYENRYVRFSVKIPNVLAGEKCLLYWSSTSYNIKLYNLFCTTDDMTIKSIPFDSDANRILPRKHETPFLVEIPEGTTKLVGTLGNSPYDLLDRPDQYFMILSRGVIKGEAEKYFDVKYVKYDFINAKPAETVKSLKLSLPEKITCLKERCLQLFWKDCVKGGTLDDGMTITTVYNRATSSSSAITGLSASHNYKNHFEITPVLTGNVDTVFSLYDQSQNLIDQKIVRIDIVDAPPAPESTVNVLMLGDSLTDKGVWCNELIRMLASNTLSGYYTPPGLNFSNIKTIGYKEQQYCRYEGFGGWTYGKYASCDSKNAAVQNITTTGHNFKITDIGAIYKDTGGGEWILSEVTSSNTAKMVMTGVKISADVKTYGTSYEMPHGSFTLTYVSGGMEHADIDVISHDNASATPFANRLGTEIDVKSYVNKFAKGQNLDYCVILLGWNETLVNAENFKNSVKTFLSNITKDYPDCKFMLVGLQHPSRDGVGRDFTVNNGTTYIDALNKVYRIEELYEEISKEVANVKYVKLAPFFDSEHSYVEYLVPANYRDTSEEHKFLRQSNGVHPNTPGQMQIADCVFNSFIEEFLH